MNKYEMLTIFSASLSDEQKDAIVDKYAKLMEKGGKVESINKANPWGLRKLAYPIKYKSEGYYVLYNFEATADVVIEVVSLMRIDENVLRQMCLRIDN